MTSHHLLAHGTAALALAFAAPAIAGAETAQDGTMHGEASPATDQGEPTSPPHDVRPYKAGADYRYPEGPYATSADMGSVSDPHPHQPEGYAWNGPHPARPVAFDRAAWLDECGANYRHNRSGDNSAGGGVLGALVGGVIGNRVADGDRLAGTLIGAGVGGLAGVAIGSAIDSASTADEAHDYCAAWLDQYYAGGHSYGYSPYVAGAYPHGPIYLGQAYYPAPMMYVQVMVPVERRTVVREYVEYVDEPVTIYEEVEVEEVVRERVIEPAATEPVTIKQPSPEPVSVKGD